MPGASTAPSYARSAETLSASRFFGSRSRLGWAFATALFAAGLLLTFRHQWLGTAARSINDNGDGTIAIAILEHWLRVFRGLAPDWQTPEWYWPAPHALSYTDSLFLLSLPYALARSLGADWFTSIDITVVCLATTGFWGMLMLARRGGVPPAIGAVFAFVFAFGAVPTLKIFHIQTYTMQLAPGLGLLLLAAWRSARWAGAGWAALAGLLYGLMFFTAAQTPWFLGLEIGLLVLLAALFNLRVIISSSRLTVWRAIRLGAAFGAGFVVGMIPFVALYRRSVGLKRSWDEVMMFTGHLTDLMNIPSGNYLWSDILRWLHISVAGRNEPEIALGWTPVLALCAGLGFLLFHRIRRAAGPHPWDGIVRPLLLAAAMGPIVSIYTPWFDLWYLVYRFVPGGGSIRTPFRIEMAAAVLLCLGVALVAARLSAALAKHHRTIPRLAFGAVLALLVVEQLGAGPITRDSNEMRAWLNAAKRPDPSCEAFYLIPSTRLTWQEYQSDAMMLSELLAIPTINGNSSFRPDGWDLRYVDTPDYPGSALTWIDEHGLRDRICGIEPRNGQWIEGVGPLIDAPAR